jgi:N-acetylneuraminic acid mutarotase
MKTKTKPKSEYTVAVPDHVWIVFGSRGGAFLYRDATKAQAEWERRQALRSGRDTGTDPMIVKFVPDIARPK